MMGMEWSSDYTAQFCSEAHPGVVVFVLVTEFGVQVGHVRFSAGEPAGFPLVFTARPHAVVSAL